MTNWHVNTNSNLVLLIRSKYSIQSVGIVNIARVHTNCKDLIDRYVPRAITIRAKWRESIEHCPWVKHSRIEWIEHSVKGRKWVCVYGRGIEIAITWNWAQVGTFSIEESSFELELIFLIHPKDVKFCLTRFCRIDCWRI